MAQAFSIRRRRVSGCLAELVQRIQSRRAMGVISAHNACASGAAARALRRSMGTLVSSSSPARVISTVTVSRTPAPAASCMASLTLSQWLPLPVGSRAARKGKPLIVPSAVVLPRDGSFALAFLGRIRRAHDAIFSAVFGRNNLPRKRIVDLVSCSRASVIGPTITRLTNNGLRKCPQVRVARSEGSASSVSCLRSTAIATLLRPSIFSSIFSSLTYAKFRGTNFLRTAAFPPSAMISVRATKPTGANYVHQRTSHP